jgi:hypothetical protein
MHNTLPPARAIQLGVVKFVSSVRPADEVNAGMVMVDVDFGQGVAPMWLQPDYMIELAD